VQLIEQRLGLLQVGRIEAFGEPIVDRREKIVRLPSLAMIAPKAREARRRPQLPGPCLLPPHTVRGRGSAANLRGPWWRPCFADLVMILVEGACRGYTFLNDASGLRWFRRVDLQMVSLLLTPLLGTLKKY
jgi:hypothetical protein